MKTTKKQIIIIGGGFAGLTLIKKADRKQYDILLIDEHNYHAFPPLFYQVASSGLEPASICFPFRKEIRKMGQVRFHLGRLLKIDPEKHIVETTAGSFYYDILVLANGCKTNFFGNTALETKTFSLKSTPQAIALRNQILEALENATVCTNPASRSAMLTFVVIGGGPTGVEIAGALGEMKKYILSREYPEISPREVQVILAEGSERLLQTMSPVASAKAQTYLGQLEVTVRLKTLLSEYDGEKITFKDGSELPAYTVIWTAGIVGEKIQGLPDTLFSKSGRILTDVYNRVEGVNDIYAIGDIAQIITPAYPKGHPQLAQVAIQQAKNLARNLKSGQTPRPFRYKDKGSMATIGRNRAVVDLPHTRFQGRLAWFVWMFVHLLSLLGMKNKIFTFLNWVWSYFTYDASLRLLIRTAPQKTRTPAC